ncbi:MAG: gamma-glutamylcyclotransferase [Isosphaera sp.]|nr:gamma-glutamylcyclotransferase [Isosphaera sp.]
MATTVLFVYGTLRQGQRNHARLAGQAFLGDAATAPRYRVLDLGPYPGLVPDDAAGVVVSGELWAVSDGCLAELDDFEGVPDLFDRRPVEVAGRADLVFAYFWNGPVPG